MAGCGILFRNLHDPYAPEELELRRKVLLGRGLPHYHVYAVSFGIALAVMVSGLWYFRRVERYFADLI